MFEFSELEDLLGHFQISMGAAESHAFISGFICASKPLTNDAIQEYMMADLSEETAGIEECFNALHAMATEIGEQMVSPEFGFQLMLPDEYTSIDERSTALAEWCQGFLSGLGVAGAENWQALSSECHELLDDLEKIGRLAAAEDELEDESAEVALNELTEYVRMGTLLVHDEIGLLHAEQEPGHLLH